MKSKLFCVRDQKLNMYGTVFNAPTLAAVMRQLEGDVREKHGDLGKYPQDFDLYELGDYDSESGTIAPYGAPKHICSCLTFKNNIEINDARNSVDSVQNIRQTN